MESQCDTPNSTGYHSGTLSCQVALERCNKFGNLIKRQTTKAAIVRCHVAALVLRAVVPTIRAQLSTDGSVIEVGSQNTKKATRVALCGRIAGR